MRNENRPHRSIIALTTLLGCFCAEGLRADTIDLNYLSDYSLLGYSLEGNAIGETFLAQRPLLNDASFMLTNSPGGSRVWYNDAHLQVFRGIPQGFGADAPNAIYTSPQIDFTIIPQVGVFGGKPLYELKFSATGMPSDLPLYVGEVYSIALCNFGNSGDAFYAAHQPSTYPDGGSIGHRYDGTSWPAPATLGDLAFRVTMSPEPASLASVGLIAAITMMRRRGELRRS